MPVPPFLATVLMDANTEEPWALLHSCCKALNDFDEQSMVMVPEGQDSDSDDDATAKETFYHVAQFLYIAKCHKIMTTITFDMLTMSHPCEWALCVTGLCNVVHANQKGQHQQTNCPGNS